MVQALQRAPSPSQELQGGGPARQASWLDEIGLGGLGNSEMAAMLFGGGQQGPGEVDDLSIGLGTPFGAGADLQPGQWRESDRLLNPREEGSSFWDASVKNTHDRSAGAYETIAERHAYYGFADSYLAQERPELDCKWFEAAHVVTGANALGAADGPNAWYMSDETEDFVRQGNEFLFSHNQENLARLAEDGEIPGLEGLKGKDLDYALVDFEQNKLQEFMTQYEKDHGSIDGIAEELSGNMGSMFAPEQVKVAMAQFEEQGITFDFRDVKHRIALGRSMVDQAHGPTKAGSAAE